ncbi:MAG: prepilin-type N-terminal cleavage/methylation domain-containing protein, partial [Clostridiaceae bacterium]|nr:prepilin-type N-terminal cleavage/methylation domain-containing protein [Clostridiaceae bacterium]
MLKSMSKKGFTLVEVICSLSIFSIIFISVMSFDITSSKMKKTIKITNNNVFKMETLKNNIIYSMTFEELERLKT